jgi:hypothetical protein
MQKNVKNLQKFVKISKNLQKLHEIGAFWTAIEEPPCANLRAENTGHFPRVTGEW